jgi:hypothetical protein
LTLTVARIIRGVPILPFFAEGKSMLKIKRAQPPKKETPRSDVAVVLIDFGRATKQTKGSAVGFGLEYGFPPFNWWLPH